MCMEGGYYPLLPTQFVEFPFQYIEDDICLQYKEGSFPQVFFKLQNKNKARC